LVIGALSHVVVLDKKDRDEYVKKRDMVATKMTPAQITGRAHERDDSIAESTPQMSQHQ
jgi:hypothetical protein